MASLPFRCPFIILIFIYFFSLDTARGHRTCIGLQFATNNVTVDHGNNLRNEGIPVPGSNITCPKGSDYCYTHWLAELSNGVLSTIKIQLQGCWESSGSPDCENEHCRAINETRNRMYFCCCKGDLCNGRVYPGREKIDFETGTTSPAQKEEIMRNLLIFLVIMSILFALCALALYWRRTESCTSFDGESGTGLLNMEENRDQSGQCSSIVLLTHIDKGRYSTVRLGYVGKELFAVKNFNVENISFFSNERDIYNLPFMSHPSLLKYYGHNFFKTRSTAVYSIFLSYAPNESLHMYLKRNVIDWETFSKMSLSIASGLSHLHTCIQKDGFFKPCIAHRDLNSVNILVQSNLTCVICDFCLATQITGSKYRFNGEEKHAEKKSITDVGTLRYMAPEALEGAVNLSDCESALKQVDVYASGLVYWELALRCTGFYMPNVECEPYQLPFEAEMEHVTLEDMKNLVCHKKVRPSFPKRWRNTPSIQTVKDTIEECWDHDAEARLTADCVEKRFRELNCVNEAASLNGSDLSSLSRQSQVRKEFQMPVVVIDNGKDGDSCLSESTVETLVANTPSNPLVPWKSPNQYKTVSHPQQNRNPCLEPYLMIPEKDRSDSYVYKSRKQVTNLSVYMSNSTPSDPAPKSNQLLKNVNSGNGSKWSTLQNFVFPWKSKEKGVQRSLSGNEVFRKVEGTNGNLFGSPHGLDDETSPIRSSDQPSRFAAAKRPNTLDLTQKRRYSKRRQSDDLPLINGDDAVPLKGRKRRSLNVDVATKHGMMTKRKSAIGVEDGECQSKSNAPSLNKSIEEVFSMERKEELKDPSLRIKTPGDIPISVRRIRSGKNAERFSLSDDRIMTGHYDEVMTSVYADEKHLKSLEP